MGNLTLWIQAVIRPNKKLVLVCLAIVIGVSLGLLSNYWHSFKNVQVILGSSVQLNIYPDLGGDSAYSYSSSTQPLFKISSSGTIKLKKAVYDFVVSDPTHQYENPVTKVVVLSNTNRIDINPLYSDQKLAELLTANRPTIQQGLLSKYPGLSSFYTISVDRLYEHGDWYGAVLTPVAPQYDTLVVILGYEHGKWVVAAKPQISISIPSNPSIPSSVIDSVDQL